MAPQMTVSAATESYAACMLSHIWREGKQLQLGHGPERGKSQPGRQQTVAAVRVRAPVIDRWNVHHKLNERAH